MISSRTRRTAAALVAAALAAACGRPGEAPPPSPAPAPAARRPHTEADVRFMAAMIGHHAQALVMAGWAPTHGADPSIRILAERIVNGQQDEIATMEQWLRDRGRPVPDLHAPAPAHADHAGEHAMAMPGMLTGDELRRLDAARGPDFDRLFLSSMIRHHRGAVLMVQRLFDTPGAAREETVFKFANDVSADQSTEIARMETMLAALSSEGRSP